MNERNENSRIMSGSKDIKNLSLRRKLTKDDYEEAKRGIDNISLSLISRAEIDLNTPTRRKFEFSQSSGFRMSPL